LPAAVIPEPDYGAELPLTSEEGGMPGWRQTGFSPQLPGRLADWQEAFEAAHHYDTGWRSPQLQGEWARQARELEAAIRAELGSRLSWSCSSGRSATVSSGSRPYSMPPPERSAGACARAARFGHHPYRSLHDSQAVREAPPTGSRWSRGRYGGSQDSQTVTRAVPPFWRRSLPLDVADRAAQIRVICAFLPACRHAAPMLGRAERAFSSGVMPVTGSSGAVRAARRRAGRRSGSVPGTLGPDGGPTRKDHIR
jgi:hypothetical protein